MPDKTGRQTPQERRFIELFAATGDRQYAGAGAGYANPTQAASKVLARPSNVAAVQKIVLDRLFNELLPIAVDAHKRLLTSATTPAGAMVQAIKLLYDRTLGVDEAGQTKDLGEASADELEQLRVALVAKLADMAAPRLELVASPNSGVFG